MIDKCRTAVLIILTLAIVAGPALAQAYSGAGAWTSGGSTGQFVGGGISAGPGGVKTFSLGSGYTYSITSVSPADAQQLQSQGVRVISDAGREDHLRQLAGWPASGHQCGDRSAMPNMIVFGPGGFMGTGIWAGPGGTGVFASPGGVSISCRARRGRKRTGRRRSRRGRRLDQCRDRHGTDADVLVHRKRGRYVLDHPAVRRHDGQGTGNVPVALFTFLFPLTGPSLPVSKSVHNCSALRRWRLFRSCPR